MTCVHLAGAATAPDLRHHGDRELDGGHRDLVDLAVNVRLPGPPAWLRSALADSLTGLGSYPRTGAARTALAARHRCRPEQVLPTAGGAEAFTLIARAFTPRQPVIVHPQFTEPEVALRAAGHRVERLILDPDDGFALHPDAVPADADMVVIGNPTNPTSVRHPRAAVAELARPGRLLVVDEAFADAVPGEPDSLAGALERLPGLVVVRSLTKTWGLAGLRVGYVLAAAQTLHALAAVQPPWSVSTPALVAAQACAGDRAVAEATAAAHAGGADREHLLARLAELDEVTVAGVPAAPFVLLHVPAGAAVRARLRERGYAVRRGDTFPGLGPDWIRVAVRDKAVTDGFLDALRAALARGPSNGAVS